MHDSETEAITIALTWTTDEQHGWEQISEPVRHELVPAWQYHEFGDADHGTTFTTGQTVSIPRNTANGSLRPSGGLYVRTAAVG